MGQRVNIQYSVELEDLEEEVNRLFSNAITRLSSLPHASLNLDIGGLNKIDSFRQKLAKIDIMLSDVQNIIEGYIRFKTPTVQSPEVPFQEVSDNIEAEELEDKIVKFKEMLDEITNQESQKEN